MLIAAVHEFALVHRCTRRDAPYEATLRSV